MKESQLEQKFKILKIAGHLGGVYITALRIKTCLQPISAINRNENQYIFYELLPIYGESHKNLLIKHFLSNSLPIPCLPLIYGAIALQLRYVRCTFVQEIFEHIESSLGLTAWCHVASAPQRHMPQLPHRLHVADNLTIIHEGLKLDMV